MSYSMNSIICIYILYFLSLSFFLSYSFLDCHGKLSELYVLLCNFVDSPVVDFQQSSRTHSDNYSMNLSSVRRKTVRNNDRRFCSLSMKTSIEDVRRDAFSRISWETTTFVSVAGIYASFKARKLRASNIRYTLYRAPFSHTCTHAHACKSMTSPAFHWLTHVCVSR